MKVPIYKKVPARLEGILGPEGRDEFLDFVNFNWNLGSKILLEESSNQFEKRLTEEVGKIKTDISEFKTSTDQAYNSLKGELTNVKTELAIFRSEFEGFKTEVRSEFVAVRSEIKSEIAICRFELRTEMAEMKLELKTEMHSGFLGVYKEISKIHQLISTQTKWILATGVSITVFMPILMKLLDKYILSY
ncbi:hypothetical protein CH352_01185 [Leptospira hartskeerlii]|uniref:DUF1640 domain-containing protein n=1 Tax=Leptospira hartskeerlii TaxID=2023177 RepID=A0A2M9XDW6_9LEPT|nr:hypothetical protein [Leptospira hartskeerlii]PJZ25901.1 hypothetical protein CH357_09790 [Leptospira hartskeerlii]PJZ35274.1 hypothetical protein CH352_01185 [Leptospira hartskeerlii]